MNQSQTAPMDDETKRLLSRYEELRQVSDSYTRNRWMIDAAAHVRALLARLDQAEADAAKCLPLQTFITEFIRWAQTTGNSAVVAKANELGAKYNAAIDQQRSGK